jgi:hypothetical protein
MENKGDFLRKEKMMKKVLVFALVLGLAGIANATVSLVPSAATINVGDTVTISVVSDTADNYGGWLELVNNGIGTFGDLMILPGAGADATKDFSFDPWWVFEGKSFNPAAPVVAGNQFTIDFTASAEGLASITLYEFDGATPIQTVGIDVVPEPMTLGLLGLGGLFLRRRK